jgi:sugar/nucleoside kinase (ribokinase family)
VVLVVGDLAVDLWASLPTSAPLASLQHESDTAVAARTGMTVGGGAWLFSEALTQATEARPVIFAAVGDDPAGRVIRDAVIREGFRTDGIGTVAAAGPAGTTTCAITVVSFGTERRLMVFPDRHANQQLAPGDVQRVLDTLDPAEVLCTWISGHALRHSDSARRQAIRKLCSWSAQRGVPVVLDLVPHAFVATIGPLTDVELAIGHVDGVVGELTTCWDLLDLVTELKPEGGDARHAMAAAAEILSKTRRFAAVQHRPTPSSYLQLVAEAGRARPHQEYLCTSEGRRGMGDAMAVDALVAVGILPAGG